MMVVAGMVLLHYLNFTNYLKVTLTPIMLEMVKKNVEVGFLTQKQQMLKI